MRITEAVSPKVSPFPGLEMTPIVFVILLLAVTSPSFGTESGKNWALLAASSYGYFNYRHQADVCHAYQVLHAHGIPDENIVVMMYDDIAFDKNNPYPGTIYNQPDGPDVYPGVPKDYTGEYVAPVYFMNILQGKNMSGIGSGKTISSGPNDRIFVYLVDHGGDSVVSFPDGRQLHAHTLINGLKKMHEEKKFKQLVFYLEACESGSMFIDLPLDINVLAVTSTNTTGIAMPCYWDHEINVFLGDVFSVKWLEDSDMEDLNKETLEKQYQIVKNRTAITSSVNKFGDTSISKLLVADFMGTKKAKKYQYTSHDFNPKIGRGYPTDYFCDKLPYAIDARDIKLETLWRRIQSAETPVKANQLHKELIQHLSVRRLVKDIIKAIAKKVLIKEHKVQRCLNERLVKKTAKECYYEAIDVFVDKCIKIDQHEYALNWFFVLGNLCERVSNDGKAIIMKAINDECHNVENNV